MLTYSSKTASFNAVQNAADWRQLTGFHHDPEDRGKQFGLSFPQPEDVDEGASSEEVNQPRTTKISNTTKRRTESSTQSPLQSPLRSPPRSPPISQGALGIPVTQRLESRSRSAQGRATKSSSSEARSFVTGKDVKSHSGTSFVTARESLGSPPKFGSSESSPIEPITEENGSPDTNEDETPQDGGNNAGNLGDVGGGLRKSDSGDQSTKSLITHDQARNDGSTSPTAARPIIKIDTNVEAENQRPPSRNEPPEQGEQKAYGNKPRSKQVLLEVPAEVYQEELSDEAANSSTLRQTEPVSTGLVRFNIPDEVAHKGHQAKGRVAEAKSRVSFEAARKAKAEPGQLLKAERMLVRVDTTKHELPNNYSENDSLKAETTTIEKWREFIVICRRSPSEETEFVIQMNKTRVVPLLDKEHRSKKSTHQIVLQQKVTKVNMFSSLDKTIVIWAPWKKETRIYLFRPRSSVSSVEWFTFLNYILGWRSPSKLRIHVPDLDVNLDLRNPLRDADVLRESAEDTNSEEQTRSPAAKIPDGQVARSIIDRSIEVLKKSDFEDVLQVWSEEGEKVGLAWKRYDRLEWIYGANEERMYGSMAMQKTHDLELRPKRHYPTQVAKNTTTVLEEPSPVEGFLVRQTSQKGTHKRFGKTFFKRLYFSTHNNFLCFSQPGKVLPPKPTELLEMNREGLPQASEIAKMVPLVYQVDPYPFQDGHIPWLADSFNRKKSRDQLAYEESERSLRLLLEAEGYINLCHVISVRRLRFRTPAPPEQGQDGVADDPGSDEGETAKLSDDEKRTFEIVLNNGLIVRLQAFNIETRKKWVQCLREIVDYWKLRTAEDMETYRQVRQSNLDSLNIDEEMESFLGQEAQKWEVSRSIASPELFHMCGISCCRQVTVSEL